MPGPLGARPCPAPPACMLDSAPPSFVLVHVHAQYVMASRSAELEFRFMNKAFEMAELAWERREVPVGCVVECKGEVIAQGCNEVNMSKNATRHAEIVAIDQLLEYAKCSGKPMNELCSTCCLYVTVEPCIMCAFALRHVGLTQVLFGCKNERFGGCGSVLGVHQAEMDPMLKKLNCCSASEDQQERARLLLKRFYEGDNPNTSRS